MEVKSKFNIGDSVFVLDGYVIYNRKISCITIYEARKGDRIITNTAYQFELNAIPHRENEVFSSKKELIEYLAK